MTEAQRLFNGGPAGQAAFDKARRDLNIRETELSQAVIKGTRAHPDFAGLLKMASQRQVGGGSGGKYAALLATGTGIIGGSFMTTEDTHASTVPLVAPDSGNYVSPSANVGSNSKNPFRSGSVDPISADSAK